MTITQRKERLITQIASIDDEIVLEVIEHFLDQPAGRSFPNGGGSKSDIIADLKTSIRQMDTGMMLSHQEVKDQIATWRK